MDHSKCLLSPLSAMPPRGAEHRLSCWGRRHGRWCVEGSSAEGNSKAEVQTDETANGRTSQAATRREALAACRALDAITRVDARARTRQA